MKRLIDFDLLEWKTSGNRKPLLLRGARQVGKTFAARQLGKTFENCVEINLEINPKAAALFEEDLDPVRITRQLTALLDKPIIPGKTLLFLDEIQAAPKAITALRYFYELIPELHVIAAGSLLDFAILMTGIPVGRVISLYMYPMTFIEFMYALDHSLLAEEILRHEIEKPMSEPLHKKSLSLLGEYIAIGGMPEAVKEWKDSHDIKKCVQVHFSLIDTYTQDFGKYAKAFQIKYLDLLFGSVPLQQGQRFKYSKIEGEYRKRELSPCLDLLETAGVVHRVLATAAQGVPLGAQANPSNFKVLVLDVALGQTMLGLDLRDWFLNPLQEFVNKGDLVEALVGQELLGYSDPARKAHVYYWQRDTRGAEAEIDYVLQNKENIIPIEVKSGSGTTLKSMHSFLESHPKSPCGIRFSTNNYSEFNKIHSYPLYAIARCTPGYELLLTKLGK